MHVAHGYSIAQLRSRVSFFRKSKFHMNLIHKRISFGQNTVCHNISCEILLHPSLLKSVVLPNIIIACVLLLIRTCTKEDNKLNLQESLKTSPRKWLFNLFLNEGKFILGLRAKGGLGEDEEVSGRDEKKHEWIRK